MKRAFASAAILVFASCAPQHDTAKEIKIAELKGERAGIEKEIELQNAAIAELQARIDSGEDKIPGVRIIGQGPSEIKPGQNRGALDNPEI